MSSACFSPWPLAGLALLASAPVLAQDAARGAQLYLQLPGGVASCVECHGPDPLGNRNRLLNAARGPAVINEAINKAAAMGYLRTVLSDTDRSDLSAYLARVNVLEGASAVVWPRTVEFGTMAQGAAGFGSRVAYTNLGSGAVTVAPRLAVAEGLSLRHDCPAALAPGATCTAFVALATGEPGPRRGAVVWEGEGSVTPQWVGLSGQVVAAPPAGLGVLVADVPQGSLQLEAAADTTTVREFSLVNAGTAALTLGMPALTGPGAALFSLSGSSCAAALVLAPAARCTVRLSARAPAQGQAVAQLQWRNDGTHPVPLRVAVQALAGTAPPAPSPVTPPPAPAPAPAPAPPVAAPAPAPSPIAPVAPAGGGCATALQPGRADPLLPALVLLALLGLLSRRRAVTAANQA
ncbi:choice-of-anchor D domain-containing protein [Rubrivivax rivuli]|uniref:Cytochrome c n=1 Tax=Rubrivivax rivuli TaxID=1862385 RepID=A0A437RHY6_9BURK|nr:choice-of-anchor D domain-containing protein [Rubrivivax rivuli]RVU46383.1 cytochrome c [Rubrivivax rivuli]